jgi:hypothetical protein
MVWACKEGRVTTQARTVETLGVERRRNKGIPKLTWDERITQNLLDFHLYEDMIGDRSSWRLRIKVMDY